MFTALFRESYVYSGVCWSRMSTVESVVPKFRLDETVF